MNLAETHDLLTFIAAVDNRRFGDETVLAWREILEGFSFEHCRAAAVEHFALSTAYLTPAHVRDGAVRRRHEAAKAREVEEQRLEIEAGGDHDADVSDLLARLRDSLPAVNPVAHRRREVVRWERQRTRSAEVPNPMYDRGHTQTAFGQ